MEKDEQLKNSELRQHEDMDEMEGEDYDQDEFENHPDGMDPEMDMEGEMYDDEGEQEEMQNPYNPGDVVRNTFYPSQNPIMSAGYGGALRPVSANIMKGGIRRGAGRGKSKKSAGFSRGIDNQFDARTRPKNFLKDKEGLYDDAIKLKKANNQLNSENMKYKTQIKKLEAELVNQQREMDEYIMSQNQGRVEFGLNNSYMKSGSSHITQSLKNQIKDLRSEMKKNNEETAKIKRSLKATNIQELEVEMKLYVDE